MEQTKRFNTFLAVVAGIAVFFVGLFGIQSIRNSDGGFGAAPRGILAVIATSSTADVGPNGYVQLYDNSVCDARVIITKAAPITLAFATSTGSDSTLSLVDGTSGYLIPASTTEQLDSALLGCGIVFAYAQGTATTTVTLFQF